MPDENGVIAKVRKSLGRDKPLATAPVPPAFSEPLMRLVHSEIGLPALFATKATEAKMYVEQLRVETLAEQLIVFLNSKNLKKIAVPRSKFLEKVEIIPALKNAGFTVTFWDEMTLDELYDYDASVTDVWKAVAETGSLVIKPSPGHGRALSLVPLVHVAIVEPKNCVPDLVDLFEIAQKEGTGSAMHIITGPSKTADIEMNLVTGVHGPGVVKIFLLK